MADGLQDRIDKQLQELRTTRDELRVRMHLVGQELKDDWQGLERKWEHFESRAKGVGKATAQSSAEVLEALKLVGEEIAEGYRRIKHQMVD